jgi:hypothetical protein
MKGLFATIIILGHALLLASVNGFVTTTTTKMPLGAASANLLTSTSTLTKTKTRSTTHTRLNLAIPPQEILTSFLPPALGFYNSEWCFSYGYGWGTGK